VRFRAPSIYTEYFFGNSSYALKVPVITQQFSTKQKNCTPAFFATGNYKVRLLIPMRRREDLQANRPLPPMLILSEGNNLFYQIIVIKKRHDNGVLCLNF
jgi:hypothetical protein